jgi:hypothetical protein
MKKDTVQLGSAYCGAQPSQLMQPGPLEPFGPWDRNRGSQSPFPVGASLPDSSRPVATHWTRRCQRGRRHDGEANLGRGMVRCSLEEAGIGEVHGSEVEDDGGSDSWSSMVKE